SFEGVNLRYDVRGASLALVGPYFGVPLPETPRFSAAGVLARNGNTWQTTDLKGRMGKSDVSGPVPVVTGGERPRPGGVPRAGTPTVVTGGERPRLDADLTADMLDLADLGPLIGGTNRSRYKPTPKDAATLLPGRTLAFDALDKLDAHVRVRSKKVVRVADWPF